VAEGLHFLTLWLLDRQVCQVEWVWFQPGEVVDFHTKRSADNETCRHF
jgi:hypothetical protein